ncbi:MAG: YeeE/YedE thiosulfate transporter family protein [Halanaerobiales bacterium]|nr:YeeE/YedE thiosulfate transporter family protein [Halanaerobiales bacterium]
MNIFSLTRWSPYLVGILIGVLSWLSFLISKRPIGVSTAFVRLSGMIEKIFVDKEAEKKEYYKKYEPIVDWEVMLVIGVIVGSFVSALLSGNFEIKIVPDLWLVNFGNTPIFRLIIALIGGIFVGFGARMAGGCTSGHGISGTMQLAVTSWIALFSFFIGGIISAQLLF